MVNLIRKPTTETELGPDERSLKLLNFQEWGGPQVGGLRILSLA